MGKRLVCGVGKNDVDYNVTILEMVGGKYKEIWRCPAYRVWKEMLRRCYSPEAPRKFPAYAGCTVSEEWKSLANFKKWFDAEYVEGYELDKDLLAENNKVYSEDTCLFVPRAVNSFLTNSKASRGEQPLGVCITVAGRFPAYCRSVEESKTKYLGTYTTKEEAHRSWQVYKLQQALVLQSQQTPKVAKALQRTIDLLERDIKEGKETKDL